MKIIVGLTLLLSCCMALILADPGQDAEKIWKDCMTENGITEKDIDDLKSGATKLEDAKDNMKCGSQCLFAKFGFMDDKGMLLKDAIMQFPIEPAMKPKVEKALATCGDTKGANPCDTAYQISMCLFKNHQEIMNM
ncbi:general odorant-binding protein 56h-like [Drosophila busckii]|uniref:general odorant-binding protein 56h-like n=1 Tax=Drosophila busckii TaxID=30019 RepID=UPI00083EC450|nr:general odorant-binding protein 56h-like [Drosophila busckii]